MNDKYTVKIDPEDSRFIRLKKSFKEEMSKKLECQDYEKIIE